MAETRQRTIHKIVWPRDSLEAVCSTYRCARALKRQHTHTHTKSGVGRGREKTPRLSRGVEGAREGGIDRPIELVIGF